MQMSAPENDTRTWNTSQWIDALGPLVVACYYLATTKWGGYVLPGPPYVGDIAILGLLANRALLVAAGKSRHGQRDATVAILGTVLIVWAGANLLLGEHTTNAARDAAPYMYVVLALLVLPLSGRVEAIGARIAMGALLFHLAWTTVTVIFGKLPFAPVFGWAPRSDQLASGTYLFSLRPDIDVLVLGLLAAICLHHALLGRRPALNLLLAAWSLAVAGIGMQARAGFVAVLFQLLIVLLLSPARSRDREANRQRRQNRPGFGDPRFAVAVLIVAAPLAVFAFKDATVVQAIPLGLDPDKARPFETSNGADTVRARFNSWNRVLAWIDDDPGRVAAGTGFGTNYFYETGASRLLNSANLTEVRSPHNYWLNTWARLGLIGLIITAAIFLAVVRLSYLVVRAGEPRDTDLLAILIALTLPVAASFGVLLESPFGTIPFFWAVGHISVRAVQLGAARPLPDPAR